MRTAKSHEAPGKVKYFNEMQTIDDLPSSGQFVCSRAVVYSKWMTLRAVFLVVALWLAAAPVPAFASDKLDADLAVRAATPQGVSRVIVTTLAGEASTSAIEAVGGIPGRPLPGVGGQAATVPDASLASLASRPEILSIRLDRPVAGSMHRTTGAVGALWVQEQLGFTGAGVGVAIIDSGVANWHDDLGRETVSHFVDFVSDLLVPHDDYGHGTHVAGTIAGNGYDSDGARRGVAPGASLVVLKVLDEAGNGHISDVIAAIDYAIENRARFNIRIINLSVASGVYESYTIDPLTLAARRAVDVGIVVVTAAGNLGRSANGLIQNGGVTSPGNAPWVITVGAFDHQNTTLRTDDTVAPFSSRGPTHIDRAVKPDLLAPGVAVESLAAPGSTLYERHPEARIRGTVDTAAAPYIGLTGTSMAAPIVAGTVALMLEANPTLTPNLVKGILQYTAERKPRLDISAQGAGFLNARGAVQLAASLAGRHVARPDPTRWSRQILWGSHRLRGGIIDPAASAWRSDVEWGASHTPEGDPIVWGVVPDADTPWRIGGGGDDLAMLERGEVLGVPQR